MARRVFYRWSNDGYRHPEHGSRLAMKAVGR
jgi:hypothetical protein